jgi:hypothetical protein
MPHLCTIRPDKFHQDLCLEAHVRLFFLRNLSALTSKDFHEFDEEKEEGEELSFFDIQ